MKSVKTQKSAPSRRRFVVKRWIVSGVVMCLMIAALAYLPQVLAQVGNPFFPIGGGGSTNDASIVPNPPLNTASCNQGLSIALVVDASGSMKMALAPMRDNLHRFVDELVGSNDTLSDGIRISVTYFGDSTNGIQGQTLTRQVSLVRSAIERLQTTIGGTNWTSGLSVGFATLSGVSSAPRLVILMTDGQPSTTGHVEVANAIKRSGARMLGIGVDTAGFGGFAGLGGNGRSMTDNLQSVTNGSASTVNTGVLPDIIIASVNKSLGTELQKIAHGVCVNKGQGGDGVGVGNNGIGKGNSGTGTGASGAGVGLSPQSPATDQTPTPAPSATVSNTPNPDPAPKPTAQGARTVPPPTPSPFYDGKEYTPGSKPVTFAAVPFGDVGSFVWLGIIVAATTVLALGGWIWQRHRKQSTHSGK